MKLLSPLWIVFSTYSIFPTPQVPWRSDHMRSAIYFLPVVGLPIGGALILWQWLCITLKVEAVLFAAVAVLLPLVFTGGIHMDGFMDTTDALASHQTKERKLQIMKDSHVGAFAVMGCISYLLLSFALYWTIYHQFPLYTVAVGLILSRALCAVSVLTMPGARNDGMLHALMEHPKKPYGKSILWMVSLLCAGIMIILDLHLGSAGAAAMAAAFFGYRQMAKKQFGGVTGDTSGFFIQSNELILLFSTWLGGLL